MDLIELVETSTNKLLKGAFHVGTSSSSAKGSINPKMVITSASFAARVSAGLQPLLWNGSNRSGHVTFVLCPTETTGGQEARSNSDRPVPPVSGLPDENADCVPAVLHPLHQTQQLQEAHGEERKPRSNENT